MNEKHFDYFYDNKAQIIAAIELGADSKTVYATWPELARGFYPVAAREAMERLDARYFPGRQVIDSLQGIKRFQEMLADGVFDLNQAQNSGVTREQVEAILQSGDEILSDMGYRSGDEKQLKTVDDRMLIETNVCVHFIRKLLVPAKRVHPCSSYVWKHAVESLTGVAHVIDPVNIPLYISNVSFIIAAILCGIATEEASRGRNAWLKLKAANRLALGIATKGYMR